MSSLFFHGRERPLQSPRNFIRFLDPLRVGTTGLGRQFKVRRRAQIAAGKIARPLRDSIGIESPRGVDARVPGLVIIDHREKWNAIFLRREMAGRRRAENIGAVAFGSDDRRVRRAELGSDGGAESPTQMAGWGCAEKRTRRGLGKSIQSGAT